MLHGQSFASSVATKKYKIATWKTTCNMLNSSDARNATNVTPVLAYCQEVFPSVRFRAFLPPFPL